MNDPRFVLSLRDIDQKTAAIDIQGEITSSAEEAFLTTLDNLHTMEKSNILLNFSGMRFMNSSGIGLMIRVLKHIDQDKQRLVAYGLKDHFRQVFELTQLTTLIKVFPNEGDALASFSRE